MASDPRSNRGGLISLNTFGLMSIKNPTDAELKEIVKERVERLFQQAEMEYEEHPERSHRYVEIARKVAMKVNYSIPKRYRRRFCQHCYSYLMPGDNCKVRLDSKHQEKVIRCLECGESSRIPYQK